MLLKSVQGMTIEKGFELLEGQLKKSDTESQTQLHHIIKNPQLLFIFADLLTILMFEKLKLISYSNLSNWQHILPCWLSVFMDYARDSYQSLAFPPPPSQQINSILEIKKHDSSKTAYTFDFLDTDFHGIIDDAYKTHLTHTFLVFGSCYVPYHTVNSISVSICPVTLPQAYSWFTTSSHVHPLYKLS